MRSRLRIVSILILALLALACSLLPLPALRAQTSSLQLSASAAYGGYFKYGEWLPIWVDLENQGPDLDAQLRVRVASDRARTTFAAPAPLPTGSRKRLPLYVLPNNYSHELEVTLVDGDQLLASSRVAVNPRPNIAYFVGVLAPERGALSLLAQASLPGQRRDIELIDIGLDQLPDRPEALRSFDCLVLNNLDTSRLSPAQSAALRGWLVQGGRLVIGGGSGARTTVAGLPPDLLPLVPSGETELPSVAALSTFAGAARVRVPGPFLLATGAPAAGHALAAEADIPLIRRLDVGAGSVYFIALDLAISPFDAWSGTTAFWERLLRPGAVYPSWLPPDMPAREMQARSMASALTNLPALDLPSVQGLAALLGLYIILVGPANYAFLRWRRRLDWAWITIPALTLAFTAGAFAFGYLLRGTDLILNHLAVVQLQPGGAARVQSYFGLFSPTDTAYDLQIEGPALLSPLALDYNPWNPGAPTAAGEITFVQSEPAQIRGLSIDQWSMQPLVAEGIWLDYGQVVADLSVQGDTLAGHVENRLNLPLEDATLVLGSQLVRLGTIPAQGRVSVSVQLSALDHQPFGPPLSYRLFEDEFNRMGPTGPSRQVQLKQTMVDALFQQAGGLMPGAGLLATASGDPSATVVLLAWLDAAPPVVRVSGRLPHQETTALLVTALAYDVAAEGPLSVPAALIPADLLEQPVEGGICGAPGTNAIYIGRGQAVFEFHLPQLGDPAALELNLVLETDGGWWQPPGVSLYDWAAEEWRPLDDPVLGSKPLLSPGTWVGYDNQVRVRLSSDAGSGGCFAVNMSLSRVP